MFASSEAEITSLFKSAYVIEINRSNFISSPFKLKNICLYILHHNCPIGSRGTAKNCISLRLYYPDASSSPHHINPFITQHLPL
ncbi:NACHT C-terminal alpha/beta 1 domain-containing protein [Paenibacillus sp. MAH-36]|uniref:NACHT C-terminal alpha/beta 1 domain-containing protein n=1 Tax=Paenibacillus TaxID=44249 RepID=UPI0036210706